MNDRILYLDVLKILALIAVIALHIVVPYWYKFSLDTLEWQITNIIAGMLRWSVPIFFMISGALFLVPDKTVSIEIIFKKYIPRMIVSFLVWSALYALLKVMVGKITSVDVFIKTFISGNYHMWFIFAITVIYLVIPLLKKIAEDKKLTIYVIILSFIFSNKLLLDSILLWINNSELYIDNLSSESITGYVGYVMLGCYLRQNTISIKLQKKIHALAFFSCIFQIGFTSLLSTKLDFPTENLYCFTSFSNMFIAISIFLFFKNTIPSINFSDLTTKFIRIISSLSLGIYFAHDLMNGLLARISLFDLFNPFVLMFLKTILVCIGTLMIVLVLRRIPVVNKFCI